MSMSDIVVSFIFAVVWAVYVLLVITDMICMNALTRKKVLYLVLCWATGTFLTQYGFCLFFIDSATANIVSIPFLLAAGSLGYFLLNIKYFLKNRK